jgi:ribosomal protein S6
MFTCSKRPYEIILIYNCDFESMDSKLVALKHFQYLYQLGGININVLSLGENSLSYPIRKQQTGHFLKITSMLSPRAISEFTKSINLQSILLRHYISNSLLNNLRWY